jgi:co-chaperonin GroES (HSP10)
MENNLDNIILINDTFLVRLLDDGTTQSGVIYINNKQKKAEIVRCNRVNTEGKTTEYQQGDTILLNPHVDTIGSVVVDGETLLLCKKENILVILNRKVS